MLSLCYLSAHRVIEMQTIIWSSFSGCCLRFFRVSICDEYLVKKTISYQITLACLSETLVHVHMGFLHCTCVCDQCCELFDASPRHQGAQLCIANPVGKGNNRVHVGCWLVDSGWHWLTLAGVGGTLCEDVLHCRLGASAGGGPSNHLGAADHSTCVAVRYAVWLVVGWGWNNLGHEPHNSPFCRISRVREGSKCVCGCGMCMHREFTSISATASMKFWVKWEVNSLALLILLEYIFCFVITSLVTH